MVIDPRRTRSAQVADWYIPIRIGTDAAFALGIMHVLVRDNLCDRDYIANHTLGFDRVEREVLPRFTPDRVAAITGIAAADVERLAAMYGGVRKSFIRLGWGMTRFTYGGQALRTVALLPGVTGAYGRYGGGALLATAASFELNYNAVRKPSGPAAARTINHNRLGEALLEAKDPPIRALFIAANNPAITCPDTVKTRRGLAREDLFTVVHDPFMSVTARYADIVLPATTYLETEDFFRAYGTYYMQYSHRAVEPQGEAWSNLKLAQALAARMGMTDPVFRMSEPEILRELLRGATGRAAMDPDVCAMPDRSRSGRRVVRNSARRPAGWSSIRSAGETGSAADAGLAARSGEARQSQWPLRLLTAPGYFHSHTAFSGVGFLRNREGAPSCVLHPTDAAARNLRDGERVRLVNDRGAVGLTLHVRDEVQPGVVLVPGQRPDGRRWRAR